MKKTLQEQYLLIKEGKGHKDVFVKEAKRLFPNMVRNAATFKEASDVLKSKQIIKENVVEIGAINQIPSTKKESYETAFENFLTEQYFDDEKAELKKVSKQVEDDLSHIYDAKNHDNINNVMVGQLMMGYYAEMKDPKNKDKTAAQLRDIVLKNLAKNPIYYTEKGQFGDLDLGYTVDAPGLGEPKEPKGPHKSSGYGTLSEGHKGSCETAHPDMSHDEYEAKINEMDIHALPPYGSPGKMSRMDAAKAVLKDEGKSPEEIKAIIDKAMFTPEMDKLVARYKASLKEVNEVGSEGFKWIDSANIPYSNIYQGFNNISDLSNKIKAYWDEIRREPKKYDQRDWGFYIGDTIPTYFKNLYFMLANRISDPGTREFVTKLIGMASNEQKRAFKFMETIPDSYSFKGDSKFNSKYLGNNPKFAAIDSEFQKLFNETSKNAGVVFIVPYIMREFENIIWKNMRGVRAGLDREVAKHDRRIKDYRARTYGDANESLEETQVRKVVKEIIRQELNENVSKRLQEIEKESQYEVLNAKAAKIQQEIEMREARMTRLDEDEDMKDLLDKNKIKNLKKEIKILQKAANKVNKMLDKVNKKKAKSDEPKEEIVDEAAGDKDDSAETADNFEKAAAAAKEIADLDLVEENKESELSQYTMEAEEIMAKTGDMDEALKTIPEEYKEDVKRHLEPRF